MGSSKFCLFFFALLLLSSEISSKRSSGGRRKTGSSSSSSSGWGWSRPKTDSKPQTNYGQSSHTNVDNKKLSYGADTAPSAPKQPASNPGWVVPNSGTQQKNTGWNTASNPSQGASNPGWVVPNSGTANQPKNTGWNVQTSGSATWGGHQGHQNPSGSNTGWGSQTNQNQQKPIGWNVPNSQGGYNQPKPGQQPPPYPGGTSQVGQKPGYQTNYAPPPYSGSGNQFQNPPPYGGYGTQNRFGQGQGYNTHNSWGNTHNNWGHNSYPQQGHYGGGGFGSPGFGSPFGGGGFGNRGGFGGGYGGGGYGGMGGSSPYGFGAYQKKSSFGIGSVASHVGTFFAGAMLWNLASNMGRSNYQVYHNAPQRYSYTDPSTGKTVYNVTSDTSTPNEAKLSVDFGNMTCITVYNNERFAKWANRTIRHVEQLTKQAFPFQNLANLNGTTSGSVQFNFTLEPGRIIHNETVVITCCAIDHLALDFEEILSGKNPSTNCITLTEKIPFREVRVIPTNVTYNITEKDIEKLANETVANTTAQNSTTPAMDTSNIVTNEPVTAPVMQFTLTTESSNGTTVENKNGTEAPTNGTSIDPSGSVASNGTTVEPGKNGTITPNLEVTTQVFENTTTT